MPGSTPIFGFTFPTDLDEAWLIGPQLEASLRKLEKVLQGRVVDPQLATLQDEIGARTAADAALATRVAAWETAPVALLMGVGSASDTTPAGLSAWTTVPLAAEEVDTANGHSTSTNTSRYVCQRAGHYDVSSVVGYNGNTAGVRGVRYMKNGATSLSHWSIITPPYAGTATSHAGPSLTIPLAVGDYLELQTFQSAVEGLGIRRELSYLSLRYRRPL